MNGWLPVQLVFVPQLFSAGEWQALRDDLHAGRATPEDVAAARDLEYEELREFFNPRWHRRLIGGALPDPQFQRARRRDSVSPS